MSGLTARRLASQGFDRRKPIVKWSMLVKAKPRDGGIIDGGDSIVLVHIETKEAHWSE
jgi:hypothetical protein